MRIHYDVLHKSNRLVSLIICATSCDVVFLDRCIAFLLVIKMNLVDLPTLVSVSTLSSRTVFSLNDSFERVKYQKIAADRFDISWKSSWSKILKSTLLSKDI